jgi:hypothetical protein
VQEEQQKRLLDEFWVCLRWNQEKRFGKSECVQIMWQETQPYQKAQGNHPKNQDLRHSRMISHIGNKI